MQRQLQAYSMLQVNASKVSFFAQRSSGASVLRQFALDLVNVRLCKGQINHRLVRSHPSFCHSFSFDKPKYYSQNSCDSRAYFGASAGGTKQKFGAKMVVTLAPTVTLNNGYEMPVLGLGTYELKKNKCENALRQAIDIGYRHIDTAYLYRNEEHIGKVIKEKMAEGVVRREDIFLVTKLWDIFHEPKMVKHACRKQLQALGVSFLDLYLMHSPVGCKYVDDEALMPHENGVLQTNDVDYVDTYKAMEELVDIGWARSLGLSNFNSVQIQRILDTCRIKPVINQIECHPALNQLEMIEFCRQRGIWVTAYSPLARPKPTKPTPPFYLSEKAQSIAVKYNKTVPQIVLRFLLDIGTIPIPKSSNYTRLTENINVFDLKLTPEEIEIFKEFHTGERLWKFEKAKFHQHWPYGIAF